MARFFASAGALSSLYALFNGQDGDGVYAIGAATREGSTWTEYGSNPIFQKTGAGWEGHHVKDPWLMYVSGGYVMYYSGYNGTSYAGIGRATASAHTGAWTRYGSNPVLTPGAASAWDDAGVTFPTVLYEPADTGREWKMWYIGNNEAIGYAYSTDGLAWTKYAGNPVVTVGSSGAWDDEGVGLGSIYKSGGTYYMFISGRQGTTVPKWQGGLVTFTDPEGTYTKYAGNPTLLARFNDANTTLVPTADVTAGATTVSLSTTGAFRVGEAVTIADGDTTAEHFYITALTSTLVTLSGTVVGNFTGGGKVFRSFAYNSAVPRSILAVSGGGYEAFGTPFQPVEDLTQPASKLWEGALEWTASALTGTWAYRYVAGRGLLFPLSPGGAAWHSRSAENPSVIAAP